MIKVLVRKDKRYSRTRLAQIVGESVLGLGGAYNGLDIDVEEDTQKFLQALPVYRHKFVLWANRIVDDASSYPVAIAFFA